MTGGEKFRTVAAEAVAAVLRGGKTFFQGNCPLFGTNDCQPLGEGSYRVAECNDCQQAAVDQQNFAREGEKHGWEEAMTNRFPGQGTVETSLIRTDEMVQISHKGHHGSIVVMIRVPREIGEESS